MKKLLYSIFIFCIHAQAGFAQSYNVGEHEFLLTPSGKTLPVGSWYITGFEVVYLNLGYAPTEGTQVGIGVPMPIFEGFEEGISFGAKQQYFNQGNIYGALWATYAPFGPFVVGGASLTYDRGAITYNLAAGYASNFENDDSKLVFSAAVQGKVSKKLSVLGEYITIPNWSKDFFGGFLCVGVRFSGEELSWDLALCRPLEDTGDLLAIPFLKATYQF